MRRSDCAFPCGRCLCNHCANNVETIDNCTGEAKEPCFSCDECRWYDGDTRHKDMWRQECGEYIVTNEHAERLKKIEIDNRRTHIMKIIAVMTQKGGVGKTMTASSLAYILGVEHGKRVLIADADQQGNISMLYGRFEPQGIGMSELLEKHRAIGGTYSTEQLIDETPYENISIIPANGFLMRTNMTLLLLEQDNQILRFKMAMEEIRDRYDYCIVDCGLLMDMTVTNVLVAADLVILPVKVGGFEIEAIVNMEEQLEDLRGFNPDIRMKLLMTMRQKNMTSLQVEEWLKASSGQDCFQTAIRRSIVAEKATMERVPLPKFSKSGIVAKDYREVAEELLKDMEG